jgi:branched-chain amino acid transport system substrate-binding protein
LRTARPVITTSPALRAPGLRPALRFGSTAALSGLVGIALLVPATSAHGGQGSAKKELVIASLAPETGEYATVIESLREPVKIAVDEVNAAGGVAGGRAVRLVTADEGIESRTVVDAARNLVDDEGADAIMGPAASTSALSILDTVRDTALVCSGSNTAAQLTKEGPARSGGMYFRTSPPDRLQGPALAELVLSEGRSDIGLVHPSDTAAAPLARSVARALEEGGADVRRATFPSNGDPADAVTRILRAEPDAVVVVATASDGAAAVRTLVAQGSGPTVIPVYGNDGLYDPGFADDVDIDQPAVVAGLKGTVPAADPAGVDTAFDLAFAATGIDPFFSSYYYDCTILTALAAVKARSDDPQKMAKVFASNLRGKQDCSTFAECKELLERGRSIHYRGASSSFDEWDGSEPGQGTYDVWSYSPAAVGVLDGPDSQITIP